MGPNVAKGVVVDGMDQRFSHSTINDTGATIPMQLSENSTGCIRINRSAYRTYEQWNWNAAVERDDWMEDNGHTYVEGLTKENIEWDKLRGVDYWNERY